MELVPALENNAVAFIPSPYQSTEGGNVAFAHNTTLAPLCAFVDILATEKDTVLALVYVIAVKEIVN